MSACRLHVGGASVIIILPQQTHSSPPGLGESNPDGHDPGLSHTSCHNSPSFSTETRKKLPWDSRLLLKSGRFRSSCINLASSSTIAWSNPLVDPPDSARIPDPAGEAVQRKEDHRTSSGLPSPKVRTGTGESTAKTSHPDLVMSLTSTTK